MNILQLAGESLAQSIIENASVDVTYTQGAIVKAIKATPTAYMADVRDTKILRLISTERDFLTTSGQLAGITPTQRDIIECNGEKWQVNNLDNTTCYRYSDPYKNIIRIHTKKIHG